MFSKPRAGQDVVEKAKFLSVLGIDPRFHGLPGHSIGSILTEIFKLHVVRLILRINSYYSLHRIKKVTIMETQCFL
jgi:hypothetical protein